MKVIFEKQALIDAIIPALGCVSSKNTIQSIEGINIKCDMSGKCLITSYDLEKGYRTELIAQVIKEGNYIINAQKLSQIVRVMPDGFITIEIDERNLVKIYSGRSEFELHALNGEDFPTLPELSGEKGFTIEQGVLKKIISQTQFAIAQNNPRPALNGSFFKIEGSKITVVSCDGDRMALVEQNCKLDNQSEDGSELDVSFIIPGKTITELMKLLMFNEELIAIKLTRKHVIFAIGQVVLFSRLIENEYLDYERYIPKNNKTFVKIDRESFVSSLERASLVTEDRSMGQSKSTLKCTFNDNLLKISSVSVTGKVYDEIFTEKTGDDLEIGFNCRYLLDALRACDADRILFSLSSPLMSTIIEPAEKDPDSRYVFLVLPCKM